MTHDNKKELSDFQIRNLRVLTHLLINDVVTDEVVEDLHMSELEYFTLLRKYRLLEGKTNIDEKTNLLKYRKDYLTNILKTASRIYFHMKTKLYTVSFIRFDIDDFSLFNNRYGHDIGDMVLVEVASILRENSRPTDYVIRFGGEEFDVILPAINQEGAVSYLNKILPLIRNLRIKANDQELNVTVSAGLSELIYDFDDNKKRIVDESAIEESYKELQHQADNALYEAKFLGKDRFCVYSEKKETEYTNIRKEYSRLRLAVAQE